MKFKPRPNKWNWRNYLTPHEASAVKEYDRILSETAMVRSQYVAMRAKVANRALQRAKAAS